MIVFQNVTRVYPPGIVGVQNASLRVQAGEFVSVVGQSGTGKTTLAKLMIGEERPDRGTISIGGWDITHIRSSEIPFLRRQIGVVFQDFKLLPQKTIAENVAFALEVCSAPPEHIRDIVPHVLKLVGIAEKADRYPHQLSGGQKQRAVIARALVHRPKILVADEPTGNLDTINTRDIIELLKTINGFGTTVLLVTHNREVVNALKRRVITLEDGSIVNDREVGRYSI